MEKSNITFCPPTLWAQTKDRLLLTFCVQDSKDVDIKFEANKITFNGQGGTANQKYEASLQLLKEIDPENSKWDRTSRLVSVTAMKKESGPFWGRLLESKVKQHWLKVDFDKMKDSDESSEDEEMMGNGQPDLSQMMAQMGRGTGTPDFGDLGGEDSDDEDSDDEGLPELETAEPAQVDTKDTAGGEACSA